VSTLSQNYIFVPAKHKETYLIYLLTQFQGKKIIIFCTTCANCERLTLILRNLDFKAINLNGQMSQTQRLTALNKFKAGEKQILVATDVAQRGLDIPEVDFVLNFDIPGHSKDYVHRVGRTARAGRSGKAITIVTQYDVENFKKIEDHIQKKLEEYPLQHKEALSLTDRVVEAQRLANLELKQRTENRKGKDEEEEGDGDKKLFGIGQKRKQEKTYGGQKSFNRSFSRKKK